MESNSGFCHNCKAPCTGDFKKVVDLPYLAIYLHTKRDEQSKTAAPTYILHNVGNKQLIRSEYISELYQFKPKCTQCKSILQRVRRLLDEVKDIKVNEVIGICEHCKRARLIKCKKCEFIVSKYMSINQKRCEERQQRFKLWLCRVRYLLQAIIDRQNVCQHKVYDDPELERILHELQKPLSIREPDIDFFTSLDPEKLFSLQHLSQSKEVLEELLSKIKVKDEKCFSSDESLLPSPSEETCFCKSHKERYLERMRAKLTTKLSELAKDTEAFDIDLSNLLNNELYKTLIKRLLQLSKSLPEGLNINRQLILNMIGNLNEAINKQLTTDIIEKLIKNLRNLNVTMAYDILRELNRGNIIGLIEDLNNLLQSGSSKNLSHNLIKLLVNLSDLLAQNLSKDSTSTKKSRMPAILRDVNKQNQDLLIDQNIETSESHGKDKTSGSSIWSNLPKVQSKKMVQTSDQLLISQNMGSQSQEKDKTTDSTFFQENVHSLPKVQNKEMKHGFSKDLNKETTQGTQTSQRKNVLEALAKIRTKTKEQSQILSKGQSKSTKELKQSSSKILKEKEMTTEGIGGIMEGGDEKLVPKDTSKRRLKKGKSHDYASSMQKQSKHQFGHSKDKHTSKLIKRPKSVSITNKTESLSSADTKKEESLYLKKISDKLKLKQTESRLDNTIKDRDGQKDKYKMHKAREVAKQSEMEIKNTLEKLRELVFTHNLVSRKRKIAPLSSETSETSSIVECDIEQDRISPKLMIKGDSIVPLDALNKGYKSDKSTKTQVIKTHIKIEEPGKIESTTHVTPPKEEVVKDGAINYRLSDREFIDKGWTILPTKKIMRRMNIYRMEPSNPQYDWFERHKRERQLFYPSGKKLASIDDDGRGQWFYRNGVVALDYHNAKEQNARRRYVVYSSGNEMENGKLKPHTVLALFDYLGNGVVYDHYGNVRLKYNQSEGVILDPKLGPPCKWKWHSLNDPPVLQTVYRDTHFKERLSRSDQLLTYDQFAPDADFRKESDAEMLAIELDNFLQEKTARLFSYYKPYPIKMKAVKLNEQFSLRILDQTNINLLFRDGITSLKLNLGMLLISSEIVDTDTSDMLDVAIPVDKCPANSDSIEDIQKILRTVRSGNQRR